MMSYIELTLIYKVHKSVGVGTAACKIVQHTRVLLYNYPCGRFATANRFINFYNLKLPFGLSPGTNKSVIVAPKHVPYEKVLESRL